MKKKERKQVLDQPKPIPEKFGTLQRDILTKYKKPSDFLNEVNTYIQGLPKKETDGLTFKELIQKFMDSVEFYVSDKDRIYRRLQKARPDLEVKTIIITKPGQFSVGVKGKNNKPGNIWVHASKDGKFIYGSGVVEIGEL